MQHKERRAARVRMASLVRWCLRSIQEWCYQVRGFARRDGRGTGGRRWECGCVTVQVTLNTIT